MKHIASLDKINVLFSKSDFDKKYPLFAKYDFSEDIKRNAVENVDLARKYDQYNQSITTYVYELDKRFDKDTIKRIIIETIFKNPDEIMMSIITSYLNSTEAVKSNELFVNFYNRTSNFGTDSIEYMQENGIVLDRTYKDIPNLAIDSKYDSLKTGKEVFKDEPLDSVYDRLTYQQRRFVLSLIESNSYGLLDVLFSRFNFNTITLIKTLMSKGINDELINNEVITELDAYSLMFMFCYMIEMDDSRQLVINVITLIRDKRFNLLKSIIMKNLFDNLAQASASELNSDDAILLNLLESKVVTLQRVEEVA